MSNSNKLGVFVAIMATAVVVWGWSSLPLVSRPVIAVLWGVVAFFLFAYWAISFAFSMLKWNGLMDEEAAGDIPWWASEGFFLASTLCGIAALLFCQLY